MFARFIFCAAFMLGSASSVPANAQSSSAGIVETPQADNVVPPVPARPLALSDIDYPLNSIIDQEEGRSTLNLIVDVEGRVTFARLVMSSGSSRLDQAVLPAARARWLFQPARKDGQPTVGEVTVAVDWRLPTRSARAMTSEMMGIPVSAERVVPAAPIRESYRSTSADYPNASVRAGEQGEVALDVLVLEDGSAGEVQLVDSSGFSRLDERAIEIAKNGFKYRPGTLDGRPVKMSVQLLMPFVLARRGTIPPNSLIRFCHSRPFLGARVRFTPNAGGEMQEERTVVQQWIHLTADGSVDDVLMLTSGGWMHLSQTLVDDYTRAARLQPAVPNRPPSCWYNGSGVANTEPPRATSAGEFARRGFMYLRQGQLIEALSDLDQALKLSPSDSNILNNRCYTLALLGRAEEALVDCDRSLRIRARIPATLDSRGFVNLLLGRNDAAIADYTAALRIRPNLANSLYGRGIAKMRSGQDAEGRADIAEAMKLDQNITARMTMFGFAP